VCRLSNGTVVDVIVTVYPPGANDFPAPVVHDKRKLSR